MSLRLDQLRRRRLADVGGELWAGDRNESDDEPSFGDKSHIGGKGAAEDVSITSADVVVDDKDDEEVNHGIFKGYVPIKLIMY